MPLHRWMDQSRDALIARLNRTQERLDDIAPGRDFIISQHTKIQRVLDDLITILIPGYSGFGNEGDSDIELRDRITEAGPELKLLVRKALEYEARVGNASPQDFENEATQITIHVLEALPEAKAALCEDIIAGYEGDPAAISMMEVIMSYPCILAIVTYRIAHLLYEQKVPLIPRLMTETAHSRTGIDIHPGAQIGAGFFIDHGTGVVIGETCEIGRNVKLYQGVTLGALSFPKDDEGRVVKGIKRHPNVQDNVTIYAGATILGGETTIGTGSEIGGNVWLTHSVPPCSKVYNAQPEPKITKGGCG